MILRQSRLKSPTGAIAYLGVLSLLAFMLFTSNISFNSSAQSDHGIIAYPADYSWTSFLHDSAHSGATNMPSPFTSKVLGSASYRGPIISSLAVADGFVFLANGNGLFELNASTLNKVWTKSLHGQLISSPAVSGGVVFIGSSDGNVYALNEFIGGGTIWTFTTGGPVYSSPVIDGTTGNLFVGSNDGNVYALSPVGLELWHFQTGGAVRSSPSIISSAGIVAVGSNDNNMYFLDESTGTLLGSFSTSAGVSSSPAVYGNTVIFGSNDTNVYSVNYATHSLVWKFTTAGKVVASPGIANGIAYVGSMDGYLYALNAATGVLVWKQYLGSPILSSTALADGVYDTLIPQDTTYIPLVYVASSSGTLYSLRQSDGSQVWSLTLKGTTQSSPAAAYTHIYIGDNSGTVTNVGQLPYSTAIDTFNPSTIQDQQGFAVGDTVRIGANVAWGKFGVNQTIVNVTDPSGNLILVNGGMTFATGITQYNFLYDYTLPSGAQTGTYTVVVKIEDANPKLTSNHPRCCGWVTFKDSFTVS